MTTFLRDQIYVHFGRRLEANARVLAGTTAGAVLAGGWKPADTQVLEGAPLLMQPQATRLPATLLPVEEDWFLAQQGRVAAYTTPVSYVDSRGRDAASADRSLSEAIVAAHRFRALVRQHEGSSRVLTVFAVHPHWLSQDNAALVGRLKDTEGPIALLVASSSDPFQSPRAIDGMMTLIRERGNVGILRTDLAGVGFVANGALMASIGVGTGTRHFTPPGTEAFADSTDPSPRLLVAPLLTWWKGTTIANAGPDPLLQCNRSCCGGIDLARFVDRSLRLAAAMHSVGPGPTSGLNFAPCRRPTDRHGGPVGCRSR